MLADQIKKAILAESEKLIERYHGYHNALHLEHTRKRRRVISVESKEIKTPAEWKHHFLHNPFYVRRKATAIANSIAKKIEAGIYVPHKPFPKTVPKKGGGERHISIYQIPDAAISTMFYQNLLEKNLHRFSSFSYAYRNDRNVHFAIQDIAIELEGSNRTFIAEFDFSDFFGSISHEYLEEQLTRNGYLISPNDKQIIKAFLNAGTGKGIPQGTSISLFLANLVCWELDKGLEGCGVKFARYADDTVIWTSEYSKICDAFKCIADFSKKTHVKINADKSHGIHLLIKEGMRSEMQAKYSFDFLGYKLSVGAVSIKDARVSKINADICRILFKHLVQPLTYTPLRALIIPSSGEDKSLISAMGEIRRYLYGGLTSQQISNFVAGRTKHIYFKGLMSYYPLVNDINQLRQLDGWLVSAIYRAVQQRGKLLAGHGYGSRLSSFPFNVAKKDMLQDYGRIVVKRKKLYEIPSLSLLHSALTQAVKEVGIKRVMNPKSIFYDY